jgi:tripartite-type tricarboxylate transporter receptor subunit TctC
MLRRQNRSFNHPWSGGFRRGCRASSRSPLLPEIPTVAESGPKEFAACLRSEIARYAKVIKDAGIKPE